MHRQSIVISGGAGKCALLRELRQDGVYDHVEREATE
jgi:predicted ATPase